MDKVVKAVIFDMDGVLVDSEPLWRRAMIAGFAEVGIYLTEEDCRKTTGKRFTEVVELWVAGHKDKNIGPKELETRTVELLVTLIEKEGRPIEGVMELLGYCKQKKLKTGLATSSSHRLMNAVLKKLGLSQTFDAVVSAEFMKYGKPHPEVFIKCAEAMQLNADECLVIEDSINGAVAGKAAQMKVLVVPDELHWEEKGFAVADYKVKNMMEALTLFKTLIP